MKKIEAEKNPRKSCGSLSSFPLSQCSTKQLLYENCGLSLISKKLFFLSNLSSICMLVDIKDFPLAYWWSHVPLAIGHSLPRKSSSTKIWILEEGDFMQEI